MSDPRPNRTPDRVPPRAARPLPPRPSIRDLPQPRRAAGPSGSDPGAQVSPMVPIAPTVSVAPMAPPPPPGFRAAPGHHPVPGAHAAAAERPMPGPRPRPTPETRAPRSRPDANPIRLLVAFAGIASASAIVTAMLPSVIPARSALDAVAANSAVQNPQPSVVHVTKYVTLGPGQTAPPNAPVVIQPTPTPRVHVVTQTRQSGRP